MNEPLVITRSATHGRVVVLHVEGRLDSRTADVLRQRGAEVAAEGRNLILNLGGVTFMGSSGLGALLALSEEFQEQAGEVRIVEPSAAAKAVIQLVSLDQVLGIDLDEGEALKAMRAA
jgi:anti-sigma B factor antagonist